MFLHFKGFGSKYKGYSQQLGSFISLNMFIFIFCKWTINISCNKQASYYGEVPDTTVGISETLHIVMFKDQEPFVMWLNPSEEYSNKGFCFMKLLNSQACSIKQEEDSKSSLTTAAYYFVLLWKKEFPAITWKPLRRFYIYTSCIITNNFVTRGIARQRTS